MKIRVRFAPSPTGHLHVGNVRTALYNWLFARRHQGKFIIRIEDTDLARSERRFEDQIMEDLKWLGLLWDEGIDVGGPFGPYRQTDRFELYRHHVNRLLEQGKAYYCFCTLSDLEGERNRRLQAGEPVVYWGRCRQLDPRLAAERVASGEEATVRLKVESQTVRFEDLVFGAVEVESSTIGDFILLRSDGSAQYNLACTIDDCEMKISHVIRGEGHLSNTFRQLLIARALNLSSPAYAHLSTILGPDGTKLSKRHGATSVDELRSQGFLPEAVLNYLALLGWAPPEGVDEILSPQQLIRHFDLHRVHRSPATFDPDKFNWVNRSHLRQTDPARLVHLALPRLQKKGIVAPNPPPEVVEWIAQLLHAFLKYLQHLDELEQVAEVVFRFHPEQDLKQAELREEIRDRGTREVIRALARELDDLEEETLLDQPTFQEVLRRVKERTGRKGRNLFHPIRLAITNRASGLELNQVVPLLESGSRLPLLKPVQGVRERVKRVDDYLRNQFGD